MIVLMQHGTLGSISGSSNTSAACDTAPMEPAAAESAPEERCLTTAGGDNGSDSFADTNTESKKDRCVLCLRSAAGSDHYGE